MESNGEPPNKTAALASAVVPGAAAAVPGGGMDFLSRLPDHLLVDILLRLRTKEAVATTVLSQRWRGVWAQLPHLFFDGVHPSVPARALTAYEALAASEAHAAADIQSLAVSPDQVDARETFAWLSLAAPLLCGRLQLDDSRAVSDEMVELFRGRRRRHDGEASEMPCFRRATEIRLRLGFLTQGLPRVGVFDALRLMRLQNFQSRGQFLISDTMLPSLQELTMRGVRDMNVLTLNSKSLVSIDLSYLMGLQRLHITAPRLHQLEVVRCFYDSLKPVASITAERLEVFRWNGPYDLESVHLGEMPCLQTLGAPPIDTHRWRGFQMAQICAGFLGRFTAVHHLELDMTLGVSAFSSSWIQLFLWSPLGLKLCNVIHEHKLFSP
ncbi:putative F-box/FBD/LRR-repeat protein At3g49030 [Triticum dicoccoides]|uniref:putative F-box/FBD/LRR-repeat protein At3g49030 n=1 Tax=Triticum dicoccoides TaxID=85692 RepID=UPI001891D861|nr:putative F-box/FBD/LRR-repeat protein At3g49030 [Triticum dicoccoides]